jgi:hypothetical protein
MRFAVLGLVLASASWVGFSNLAYADEGMWTYDNFPTSKMAAAYGWAPDQAWLDHVRLSSLRLAEGCTASFVSGTGLVMTNHHCARSCVASISDSKHDYIANGFDAAALKDERRCPGMEADELTGIKDITATINAATNGKSGKAFADAQRAAIAKAEESCATSADLRCDVVTLYEGGKYDLYTYKRYQDLRLVFAVEDDAANFGGDPDNFEFPRYDIDVAFLRVYDHGKPLHPIDHFTFETTPAKVGDIVFTSGNPGSTERDYTLAQLAFQRDHSLPVLRTLLSEEAGILWEMGRQSPELLRETRTRYFFTMNSLKAFQGEQKALVDGSLLKQKENEEAALRQKVNADPALAADRGAWDQIAQAEATAAPIYMRYILLEASPQWMMPDVLRQAFQLNRVATESVKPDSQRLEAYNNADMPAMQQDITASSPDYPVVDKTLITWWLQNLVFQLGADDPDVKAIMGKQSPEQIADEIVDGTKLTDPALRAKLLAGGAKAINASQDPMLVFVRKLNGPARTVLDDYNNNVKAVVTENAALIAHAKFALYGTSVYPDATFTLRLSYGTVKGYEQDGKFIQPFTTFAGAFARATGQEPFKLPASWVKAAPEIDMTTDLDMATTNDIVGGNSGSPVINKDGQVTGLIFDGNIQSLGGDYGYDGSVNRAVAVDATALKLALAKIYHANRLVTELGQ